MRLAADVTHPRHAILCGASGNGEGGKSGGDNGGGDQFLVCQGVATGLQRLLHRVCLVDADTGSVRRRRWIGRRPAQRSGANGRRPAWARPCRRLEQPLDLVDERVVRRCQRNYFAVRCRALVVASVEVVRRRDAPTCLRRRLSELRRFSLRRAGVSLTALSHDYFVVRYLLRTSSSLI